MSTDLHFCNFCQQSVPQDKVETGDAVRHGGRVVCPTCCDTLMLATASRTEVVKPPSLVMPLIIGFVGWGLAAFAWFSHDQYERGAEDRLRDHRVNTDTALSDIISKHQIHVQNYEVGARDVSAAFEGLTAELEAASEAQAFGFAAVNTKLEPLPGLVDAQVDTSAQIAQIGTRLGLVEESLGEVRTQQEFLRDEVDTMSRIAATAGPPTPTDGEFSPEIMGLLEKLENDDSLVRYEGLEALGKHDDVRLATYVEPLLDDGYEMNRFYAAYALGEMRSLDTCGNLINLLDDDYAFVRKAAYEALQKISGEDFKFDHKAVDRSADITAWQTWWDGKKAELAPQGG